MTVSEAVADVKALSTLSLESRLQGSIRAVSLQSPFE